MGRSARFRDARTRGCLQPKLVGHPNQWVVRGCAAGTLDALQNHPRTAGGLMLATIFAWWYRDYAKKDVELSTAEAEARNAKRGLWADKSPIPPWGFRKNEAAERAARKAMTK
jgi:endonuclease YncB( thermonuclease family)